MGDEQVYVVSLAVELDQLDSEVTKTPRMVCSQYVSTASVNTWRRYVVTNTRCACSSHTLCRVRR